eukprot:ANDGO_05756.mRNA.1 hypothetical protein
MGKSARERRNRDRSQPTGTVSPAEAERIASMDPELQSTSLPILDKLKSVDASERVVALHSLAYLVAEHSEILLKNGVLGLLVDALHDPELEARAGACGAIRNLSLVAAESFEESVLVQIADSLRVLIPSLIQKLDDLLASGGSLGHRQAEHEESAVPVPMSMSMSMSADVAEEDADTSEPKRHGNRKRHADDPDLLGNVLEEALEVCVSLGTNSHDFLGMFLSVDVGFFSTLIAVVERVPTLASDLMRLFLTISEENPQLAAEIKTEIVRVCQHAVSVPDDVFPFPVRASVETIDASVGLLIRVQATGVLLNLGAEIDALNHPLLNHVISLVPQSAHSLKEGDKHLAAASVALEMVSNALVSENATVDARNPVFAIIMDSFLSLLHSFASPTSVQDMSHDAQVLLIRFAQCLQNVAAAVDPSLLVLLGKKLLLPMLRFLQVFAQVHLKRNAASEDEADVNWDNIASLFETFLTASWLLLQESPGETVSAVGLTFDDVLFICLLARDPMVAPLLPLPNQIATESALTTDARSACFGLLSALGSIPHTLEQNAFILDALVSAFMSQSFAKIVKAEAANVLFDVYADEKYDANLANPTVLQAVQHVVADFDAYCCSQSSSKKGSKKNREPSEEEFLQERVQDIVENLHAWVAYKQQSMAK